MSRVARGDKPYKYYHVMVQGIGKEQIFNTDENKAEYIDIITNCKYDLDVKVFAYAILNDHAHIVVETSDVLILSKFMSKVNVAYAHYYNQKNNRYGYVFSGRFKSQGLESESILKNCVSFVNFNPVESGLVDQPEDYAFSSVNAYINKNNRLIDFDYASKIIETSKSRILTPKKHSIEYIEIKKRDYEDSITVLKELIKKYNITSPIILKHDTKIQVMVARQLRERCGLSYQKVADMLEISREKLRLNMIKSDK